MKNALRFALAGTALLGYAVAHGQAAAPSTGDSDLWVFVTDPSTDETFAEATDISIDSLAPSTLTGAVGGSSPTTIGPVADAALGSWIAAQGSNTLYWGVQGANVNSGAASKPEKAGNEDVVQANTGPASNTTGIEFGQFTNIIAGMNADDAYMSPSLTSANDYSAVFNLANGSTVGNAWGVGPVATAGSVNLYNQGNNGEIDMGQTATLYFVTGDSSPTATQSYILATLELTSGGTLESVSSSPVPLPAALWLLGSGLLGLAGVGRRRSSAA